MSILSKLKAAEDRKDLARLLGFAPSALTSIIYKTPNSEKYTTFDIPKRSGGVRTIKAPSDKLKKLQTHLAHALFECLSEIQAERTHKSVSYGFRKGGSTSDNAKNHKRRRFVLNIDLANFFPSFNFGRVRGFFLKDKEFQLSEQVATTIAQIACDGTALPQGSPCSPIISELVGHVLDVRLLRLAKKYGVRYSRYADDITFSTNQKSFPSALAAQDIGNPAVWVLGAELINKIRTAGFVINDEKTRMQCKNERQEVTGLVVNQKVNIKKEYYRSVRAMCDSLFKTGEFYKSYLPKVEGDDKAQPNYTDNLNSLEGMLSYVYYITQSEEKREVSEQRANPRAIRKLYRRFLFYKYCVALSSPLIITEGKTDPIYLREAIRKSSSFHPLLGTPEDSSFRYAVRFFNYTGQAHEIMDLGGGTGDIKSIVIDYLQNLDPKKKSRKPFLHKPMLHPVIILLDNDDGLSSVGAIIKKNFKITINTKTNDDYYKISDNLYLIKTPEQDGESCIEDMFPKEWRDYVLKGKKFNPSNKINPITEYSKEVFAKSVILPNADSIDFSKFDNILYRIVRVIDDYKP